MAMGDGKRRTLNSERVGTMSGNRPPQVRAMRLGNKTTTMASASTGGEQNFMVVGIGASAGGLEACTRLVACFPPKTGLACVLVQHLDPSHQSLIADLLSGHTSMHVQQATEGMPIEPEHIYVIPPGVYLSVRNGGLHLSEPLARHGARLPFDYLLESLATEYGPRAACVVLSGTGQDGSRGLLAIKKNGGLVIAQEPNEAGHDGMPRSAISTGAVDQVLPIAKIPAALVSHTGDLASPETPNDPLKKNSTQDWLANIINLLRLKTPHDFTQYKHGTLERRIERRMALTAATHNDMQRYVTMLSDNPSELDLLAKDLLINVTSFFRDAEIFDLLAKTIIPELVANQPPDQPIRIWSAGCSTGDETYSLAMLFREEIAARKSSVRFQIFASDVDADAIARAREGLYPETIAAHVSADRLARFFTKEVQGYRVMPELRTSVIFAVQDVLSDPPFSRLDLISCRNLLIYLSPEAQARIIAQFHFALREQGILLLGSSETIVDVDGRFEVVSKAARIYRHIGRSSYVVVPYHKSVKEVVPVRERSGMNQSFTRASALADLCRRLVIEGYAPAAVLINERHECLFSLGPTDLYLKVASGHQVNDLLLLARDGVRAKLKAAIQQAEREKVRAVLSGGRMDRDGGRVSFSISVQPVTSHGEELLLVCFLDDPEHQRRQRGKIEKANLPRIAELEQELAATKAELQAATDELEISAQEHLAVNEEALSAGEEYQSANEELLTSKEELQSLNEELTALNNQLQEALERQRTLSNDLQNILNSTDIATIFLDINLNIRFFTPATRRLFSIIPTDIGRPLADLRSLALDGVLLEDARNVLESHLPIEREVEAQTGAWYARRVSPYNSQENGIEGVVITFADVTKRKQTSEALKAAEQLAQRANVSKSRFLASASHDLRQPMQALALLQGLLAKSVEGERPQRLVARLDDALGAMSGMLNTLLDINQIESGTVHADIVTFPINDLITKIKDEFVYLAQAQKLDLHLVSCSLSVRSDPGLLGQMLRNLISNALKYTKKGKVLIGCRRHKDTLSIEVWDTGMGIPNEDLQTIFEEYRQLGNAARERSLGLGLGLSIVQHLGVLLGHRIGVRSSPGKGSVFSIEVMTQQSEARSDARFSHQDRAARNEENARRTGSILVIEDDPEISELLTLFLKGEGYLTAAAPDGISALELITRGEIRPDLILADYNLPHGMDGLQVTAKIRERLNLPIPVIVLTGDISSETLRNIALEMCTQLNKPVKLPELTEVIHRLLPAPRTMELPRSAKAPVAASEINSPVVFVVDDDGRLRAIMRETLEAEGHTVEDYETSEAFLEAYRPGRVECLLIDAYLPGMSGLELLQRLRDSGYKLPAVMITGNSDVSMAVQAMKAGASDFIEKPVGREELLTIVERALEQSRDSSKQFAWREAAANHIADLTPRQREIMELVLAGHPSKNIAADLSISQRTVENHRAAIMRKTGSKSLPALARLALAAV